MEGRVEVLGAQEPGQHARQVLAGERVQTGPGRGLFPSSCLVSEVIEGLWAGVPGVPAARDRSSGGQRLHPEREEHCLQSGE